MSDHQAQAKTLAIKIASQCSQVYEELDLPARCQVDRAIPIIAAALQAERAKQWEQVIAEAQQRAYSVGLNEPLHTNHLYQFVTWCREQAKGGEAMTPDDARRAQARKLARQALENASRVSTGVSVEEHGDILEAEITSVIADAIQDTEQRVWGEMKIEALRLHGNGSLSQFGTGVTAACEDMLKYIDEQAAKETR